MGRITDNEIMKLRYDMDDGKPVDEIAVRALLSQMETANAVIGVLVAALRKTEWLHSGWNSIAYCPCCENRQENGHMAGCALAAALTSGPDARRDAEQRVIAAARGVMEWCYGDADERIGEEAACMTELREAVESLEWVSLPKEQRDILMEDARNILGTAAPDAPKEQ